jgi:(4-(4-[2-(gamma-L-glutamylamino)ethyl]phenoxymethyl)furan-2-yl)methanamine synthase
MQVNIMGWDIGGAHLKAAIIRSPSDVVAVYQRPCQLWKGLDKLHEAGHEILEESSLPIGQHVLTMTGELVDLFAGRDDGVKRILETMKALLPESEVLVYVGKAGFQRLEDVNVSHYADIASANWLASASWAAQKVGSGLFVDIGSTTTDILLLADGKVLAEGYSDYERLISQELVYTGIVRTPVMAVAQSTQNDGREVGLMAEYFATMADVYRVTGELDELHDQCDTADGAEKTIAASARRLARMLGCDYDDTVLPFWQVFAKDLRLQQMAKIQTACERQLARIAMPKGTPLIGAGIGRFLVKQIAQNLGRPYQDFSGLYLGRNAKSALTIADCAPAVAVASLVNDSIFGRNNL